MTTHSAIHPLSLIFVSDRTIAEGILWSVYWKTAKTKPWLVSYRCVGTIDAVARRWREMIYRAVGIFLLFYFIRKQHTKRINYCHRYRIWEDSIWHFMNSIKREWERKDRLIDGRRRRKNRLRVVAQNTSAENQNRFQATGEGGSSWAWATWDLEWRKMRLDFSKSSQTHVPGKCFVDWWIVVQLQRNRIRLTEFSQQLVYVF